MKWATLLVAIVIGAWACGHDPGGVPSNPAAPAETANPAPPGPSGPITLGQQVQARLEGHGDVHTFELTAPYSGTLTARVTWPGSGLVALCAGEVCRQSGEGAVVANLQVATGIKYLVRVADGAPWDYENWHLDYVLTTAIEP